LIPSLLLFAVSRVDHAGQLLSCNLIFHNGTESWYYEVAIERITHYCGASRIPFPQWFTSIMDAPMLKRKKHKEVINWQNVAPVVFNQGIILKSKSQTSAGQWC